MTNLNEGHRKRLRRRLLTTDINDWEAHEVAELVLYWGNPRSDTNKAAHRLIDYFGGFEDVLQAEINDLIEIKGVTQTNAEYFVLLKKVVKYLELLQSRRKYEIFTFEDAKDVIIAELSKCNTEDMLVIFMDASQNSLFEKIIHGVTPMGACISFREIATYCISYHAASVMLAHTHPSGFIEPSDTDDIMTRELMWFLNSMGVTLFDHIITSGREVYSYQVSGRLKKIAEELKNQERLK
ncbi:MAG: JAB domain-containing protein [Clostridia bacterium]